MPRRLPSVALLLLAFLGPVASAQQPSLRVVSAGPSGEVTAAAQANEIRVVFSEPMVAVTEAPRQLKPAFFHISPGVTGSFRWSGATTLIFTPATKLPLATRYDVTIDAGTPAVSGRALAAPYRFSFTTPTARLMQTHWYRPGGKAAAAPIIVLRFNQAVKPEAAAAHVSAAFEPHEFVAPPDNPPSPRQDAGALQAFNDKIARARGAAGAAAPVALALAKDWDKKKFPPSADTVVFQAVTTVPPESWVKVTVDGGLPGAAGKAVSVKPQAYTIKVEPTFFVDGFRCTGSCNPDSSNPIRVRVPVKVDDFAKAMTAADVTNPREEVPQTKTPRKGPAPADFDDEDALTFEGAGFPAQPPATTWVAALPPDLTAADGQTLGYAWTGSVENWHQRAFTSFGDGHGVWEKDSGAQLPFYARNFQGVRQWAAPVDPLQLMPTLLSLEAAHFKLAPPTAAVARRLGGTADRVLSHGLDIAAALKPSGTGLVWTAVEEGTPIPRARASRGRGGAPVVRASLIQVTNLAISVKDSPQNTLIFVTTLDSAVPVAGAHVSIIGKDGRPSWSGTTGPDGFALAPQSRMRDPQQYPAFSFVVTAEKDGDVAYLGSDWNDGIMPWDFGLRFDLDEADPLLRGSVFADRGVYKPGEEVHLKAILRSNTPSGVKLLPEGTAVWITVHDARDTLVDERTIKVNGWSAAEWTMTVPADGTLGEYAVRALLEADKPKPAPAQAPDREENLDRSWKKSVNGGFLVAAYRRPDFRVDVSLGGSDLVAGAALNGKIAARYLFGAAMGKRPARWTLTRAPVFSPPAAITAKYSEERWAFVGWPAEDEDSMRIRQTEMGRAETSLSAGGELPLTLNTEAKAGIPYVVHARGGRRRRVPSAHRQPRQRGRPSRALVCRHPPAAALQPAARWRQDRDRGDWSRRQPGRRRRR